MNSVAERTVHVQGLSSEAESYLQAQARIWQRTHSTQAAVRAANAWAAGYRAYENGTRRSRMESPEERDGFDFAHGEQSYWLCIANEGIQFEAVAA